MAEGSEGLWQHAGIHEFKQRKADGTQGGRRQFYSGARLYGEDLIYGIASAEQVQEDAVGNQLFPMHQIRIRDFEGNILKSYEQAGVYVTGCRIEETRSVWSGFPLRTEG